MENKILLIRAQESRLSRQIPPNVETCLFPTTKSFDPYRAIVVDLSFIEHFSSWKEILSLNEPSTNLTVKQQQLFFSTIEQFAKKLLKFKGLIFVLNNLRLQRFGVEKFLLSFFQFWNESQLLDETVEESNHITSGDDYQMFAQFTVVDDYSMPIWGKSFFRFSKLKPLHTIVGNTNKVVGFEINRKYLLPFSSPNKDCWNYIKRIIQQIETENQEDPKLTKILDNRIQFLKDNFGRFFGTDLEQMKKLELQKITLETQIIEKQKKFEEFIKTNIRILFSADKKLESDLINFFKHYQISAEKDHCQNCKSNEMDFCFEIPEEKLVIIGETKSYTKNTINETPFGQLIKWSDQFQEKHPDVDSNSIFLLVVVNNGYELPINKRQLKIPDNLEQIYGQRKDRKFRVVTTKNLLDILYDKGKDAFFKKMIDAKTLAITFEDS